MNEPTYLINGKSFTQSELLAIPGLTKNTLATLETVTDSPTDPVVVLLSETFSTRKFHINKPGAPK